MRGLSDCVCLCVCRRTDLRQRDSHLVVLHSAPSTEAVTEAVRAAETKPASFNSAAVSIPLGHRRTSHARCRHRLSSHDAHDRQQQQQQHHHRRRRRRCRPLHRRRLFASPINRKINVNQWKKLYTALSQTLQCGDPRTPGLIKALS